MEPDSADPSRAKTYHLKWSSHIPNLETVFTTLLESESLSDVTLVCSDGSIKSHRLLLASCSNYFLRVFLETPTKKPMIVVPEITTETMKHLLAFIYTGEVRVVEEVLENLIAAATMLQIRGLATASENEGGLDDSVEVTTNYQGLNKSKDRSFDEEVTPLEKLSPKKSESREGFDDGDLQKSSPSRKSESSPMKRMRSTYDSSPIPEVSILPILAPRLNLEQPQYIEEEDNNRPKQSSDFNGEDSLQESEDPESTYSHPQTQHLLNQSSQIHPGLGTLENMYNHFLQGKITPSPSSAPDSPTVSSKSSNNSVTTVANLSIQQEEIARLMAQVSCPTCPICQKDCGNYPNLRSHLQIHVNIKPFVCEFCEAKFSRASHLCRHRRTHTGEKPYECKKCGKLFSRQDKLKTHMDRHISKEDIPLNNSSSSGARKAAKGSSRSSAASKSINNDYGVSSFSNMPLHPIPPHSTSQPPQVQAWNNNAFPGINPYCLPSPHSGPANQPQMASQNLHDHPHQMLFSGQPVQHMISDRNAIMASLMKIP
ncbi:zinc finger and BTB domain-containing protein 14-like [Tigriopus californicus]|uniref:zinc finger and BTB domain-containing protein 14-like n=1 Tax=Tigriopus californicus TaxID=6832 RepID=UPI0027DA382F|nr:zinc finger and BTB domain-containing protein 14-like [Tigriopus californicus]